MARHLADPLNEYAKEEKEDAPMYHTIPYVEVRAEGELGTV
jgi:hypothetical protein